MRNVIILLSFALCSCGAFEKNSPQDISQGFSYGIDISHHNKLTDSDWKELKRQNVKFVYIKISEGATYKDPMRFKHYDNAQKYNIKAGVYHFFRDDVPAEAQYRNFARAHADRIFWDIVPCIDYEKAGFRKDFKTRIKVLKELLDIFYQRGMPDPVIYCDLIQYAQLKPLFPNIRYWISASSPDLKVGSIKQYHKKVNGKLLDFNEGSLKEIIFSN